MGGTDVYSEQAGLEHAHVGVGFKLAQRVQYLPAETRDDYARPIRRKGMKTKRRNPIAGFRR